MAFYLSLLRRNIKDMTNIQLTQELVRELFDYKDGFLYWKVKFTKGTVIGERAGYLKIDSRGNRYKITINKKYYYYYRVIFLWHHGWLPQTIDHIDHNKLNDRIENLRAATQSQNCKNTSSRKNSSSKYLGVSFCKRDNKWAVGISVNGKNIFLGRFATEKEAALIYNNAASLHFGEFANLNIIED